MPSSSGNSGGKTLLLWETDRHIGGMTEDKLCDFGEGGMYNFFPLELWERGTLTSVKVRTWLLWAKCPTP